MTGIVDKELRKDLLFKALDRFTDLDKAFEAVMRMEQFILECSRLSDRQTLDETGQAADAASQRESIIEQTAEATAPKPRGRISRNRWQHDHDVLLQDLWSKDLSVQEIAAQLGRTQASIYGRINQLGLSPRKSPSPARRTQNAGMGTLHSDNGTSERKGELEKSSRPALSKNEVLEDVALEDVAIEEVVRFLRTRDYSIISTNDGRFKVDGRHILTPEQLLQRANRVRESMGRSRWTSLQNVTVQGDSYTTEKRP